MKCISHNGLDHPATERCYSPTACAAYGYCRERNFDGHGMSNAEIARRKAEQVATDNKIQL